MFSFHFGWLIREELLLETCIATSPRAAPCESTPWSPCATNNPSQTTRNSSSEQSCANIWDLVTFLAAPSE